MQNLNGRHQLMFFITLTLFVIALTSSAHAIDEYLNEDSDAQDYSATTEDETTGSAKKPPDLYHFEYADDYHPSAESASNSKPPTGPPRLNPNSFHRPGGNQHPILYLAPLVNYNEFDSFFGIAAALPVGPFSISPYFYQARLAGSFMGLLFRHPFYESQRRDLNIEWFASAETEKALAYTEASGGNEVEVVQEDLRFGFGMGATKRWTNWFGISAQIHLLRSGITEEIRSLETLYGFIGLARNYSIFAGIVNDDRMAGVEVGFARIGYNFDTEGLSIGISGVIF